MPRSRQPTTATAGTTTTKSSSGGILGSLLNAPAATPTTAQQQRQEAALQKVVSGGLLQTIGDSINSTLDLVKLIAWLFHPSTILRGVEFLTGMVLMVFGLHAAWQARGERAEGFTTSESALTRSELGRVATELGRSARGGSRPRRPSSAPHVTRRRALAQRYTREERVRDRERKGEKPAGHAKSTKGSAAGTRRAARA